MHENPTTDEPREQLRALLHHAIDEAIDDGAEVRFRSTVVLQDVTQPGDQYRRHVPVGIHRHVVIYASLANCPACS